MKKQIFITLFLFTIALKTVAQPGTLDTSFQLPPLLFPGAPIGPAGSIYTTSIQNDGKIIVAGYFTLFSGHTLPYIVRLNINGSFDTTFNSAGGLDCPSGCGTNSPIYTSSIQSDGKIIIGGNFTSYNGTAKKTIARLNQDGTIDNSFNVGTGAVIGTSTGTVNSIVVQSDGKIIIGGNFGTFNGYTSNGGIVRLNSDGSYDNSFHPQLQLGNCDIVSLQNDNKIVVVEGNYVGSIYQYGIRRYYNDGTADNTFNNNASSVTFNSFNQILCIKIQNDGKIIVGGQFNEYGGSLRKGLIRFNSDGSIDTSIGNQLAQITKITSLAIQSDGKIIIGGKFSSMNGTTLNNIARLNVDGSLDSAFNPGTGVSFTNPSYFELNSISIQNDNKIIIGGKFSNYNGTTVGSMARINGGTALAISDFEKENIVIYPNPIQNTFHIDIEEEFTGAIFDITGKDLKNVNTKDVDISNLSAGIYFLNITSEGKRYTKKIIKSKTN